MWYSSISIVSQVLQASYLLIKSFYDGEFLGRGQQSTSKIGINLQDLKLTPPFWDFVMFCIPFESSLGMRHKGEDYPNPLPHPPPG